MVKTLPSNAEDAGSIPGGGAKIPYALGPKNKTTTTNPEHKNSRSSIVTNTIEFKNGPH